VAQRRSVTVKTSIVKTRHSVSRAITQAMRRGVLRINRERDTPRKTLQTTMGGTTAANMKMIKTAPLTRRDTIRLTASRLENN